MITFATALDLSEVNLLGFSIGGFAAQDLALIRPALVRRLILAATGPKGGPGMHGWVEDIADAARLEQGTAESLLHIFFAPTETSRAKGREFLSRFTARREDRDPPSSVAARDAQYDASGYERLAPVLPYKPIVPAGASAELRLDATKDQIIPEYPY